MVEHGEPKPSGVRQGRGVALSNNPSPSVLEAGIHPLSGMQHCVLGALKCFCSHGRQLVAKESVFTRKEYTSQRIDFVHQNVPDFIDFIHQYGCLDII